MGLPIIQLDGPGNSPLRRSEPFDAHRNFDKTRVPAEQATFHTKRRLHDLAVIADPVEKETHRPGLVALLQLRTAFDAKRGVLDGSAAS